VTLDAAKTYSYMFDEPSSYLDVKQRLGAAQVIRGLLNPTKYVFLFEPFDSNHE